uniref:Calcium uniporter protein C-terminal domain-containing protein n=1 Tax=Chromera velia CCMP2878 TaxID=1169474 RepID=A0A0G4G379_9ALVE|eukprot:Cvel_19915.t1-p1 / transcript=Cvel_19915.t1 / gene=Cvel_19915 / organism=Chromera_velia_CCMP2878 / gene_product=Coiled-coil domain-containing protein 109B, putative / transcript_product=Coiled-coil domain-containing protein 109B, putative / location=Cvel_scaffold1751:26734-27798(+) / protein_length=355 / sequence_SO=supercontig / SO=protein_coding / is_pseudo=false
MQRLVWNLSLRSGSNPLVRLCRVNVARPCLLGHQHARFFSSPGSMIKGGEGEAFLVPLEKGPLLSVMWKGKLESVPLEGLSAGALSGVLQDKLPSVSSLSLKTLGGLPVADFCNARDLARLGFVLDVDGVQLQVSPGRHALEDGEASASEVTPKLSPNANLVEDSLASNMVSMLRSQKQLQGQVTPELQAKVKFAVHTALQTVTPQGDVQSSEVKLQALRKALSQMQALKSRLDTQADSGLVLWGAFMVALTAAQLGGFSYCTYYVYSWDIMEPISFLLGTVNAACAWSFFALAGREFSGDGFWQAVKESRRRKQYTRNGMVSEVLDELQRRVDSLVAEREPVGQEDEAEGDGGK